MPKKVELDAETENTMKQVKCLIQILHLNNYKKFFIIVQRVSDILQQVI